MNLLKTFDLDLAVKSSFLRVIFDAGILFIIVILKT